MSCERFREAITAHACGADVSADAGVHLETCADCRREYETQREALVSVDAELRRALAVEASPDFVSRVTARTRSTPRPALAWRTIARPPLSRPRLAWLAAAAMIAVGLFLGLRPSPTDRPARAATRPLAAPPPAVAADTRGSLPSVSARAPRTDRVASAFRQKDPPRRGPVASAFRRKELPQPEVVVPPGQARAIARLRDLVRRGLVDESAFAGSRPDPTEFAELSIAPIVIPDIPVTNVEIPSGPPPQGGRDRQ